LLLVQPSDESSSGEARLNSAFVPLDGSELAEQVFSTVTSYLDGREKVSSMR
jgi:hypothetical protein